MIEILEKTDEKSQTDRPFIWISEEKEEQRAASGLLGPEGSREASTSSTAALLGIAQWV